MDRHVAGAAVAAHGTKRCGAGAGASAAATAAPGRCVVGEDVVELVAAAPATLEPAHVRPLAVAVLELLFGLGQLPLLGRVIVLLGQAEVDERLVPGVAGRHRGGFSCVTA